MRRKSWPLGKLARSLACAEPPPVPSNRGSTAVSQGCAPLNSASTAATPTNGVMIAICRHIRLIHQSQTVPEESEMNDTPKRPDLDKIARQLAETVPANIKALGEDVERNVKSLLQSGIERMDLVSREEFDLQTAVLERTREKLARLEARLAELEESLDSD